MPRRRKPERTVDLMHGVRRHEASFKRAEGEAPFGLVPVEGAT